MARTPTINSQGNVQWEEKASSPDGDNLVITLELDAVDSGGGFVQQDTDSSNVSWLDFSTTSNINSDGSRDVTTTIEVDPNGVSAGNDYRFELFGDDGSTVASRNVILSVLQGPLFYATRAYTAEADTVEEYSSNDPWDITDYSQDQTVTISQDSSLQGGFFKFDGTKFYLAGANDDAFGSGGFIYEFDVGSAWDISTLSFNQSLDVSSETDRPRTPFFKPDGKRLFYHDRTNDNMRHYNLGSAWDISTATLSSSISVFGEDPASNGLHMKSDGTRAYMVGGNTVGAQYDLTNPWDFSSVDNVQTIDLSQFGGLSGSVYSLFWKSDGTQVFIFDGTTVSFNAGTKWDITSISQFADDAVGFIAGPYLAGPKP